MFLVEHFLHLYGTAVMPPVIYGSLNVKSLPQHLDAEATIHSESKPVQSGKDGKHDFYYLHE